MKITVLLCAVSISLIGLLGCKSSKDVKKEAEVSKSAQPATVDRQEKKIFASIERTPCYGRCPTYKAVFYTDGSVSYEGKMNVDRKGTYEARISIENMNSIVARAKAIDYFNMEDKYDGNVTDLPACYTSVRNGDELKEIYNRFEGPGSLAEFEKYLEQLLDSLKWTQISESNPEFEDDAD